jgi:hypothetical protein
MLDQEICVLKTVVEFFASGLPSASAGNHLKSPAILVKSSRSIDATQPEFVHSRRRAARRTLLSGANGNLLGVFAKFANRKSNLN